MIPESTASTPFPLRAQGQLTESDYIAAQYLHLRPRRAVVIAGIVIFAFLSWVEILHPYLVAVLVLAYVGGGVGLYLPWQSKRRFRQYKALSEPITLEVRDSGLFVQREHGASLVPWSHVHQWRYNKKLLMLYPAGNLFHMFPRHFLDSDAIYQAFVELVRSRLGPPK